MRWTYKTMEIDPYDYGIDADQPAITREQFAKGMRAILDRPLVIENDLNVLGNDGWELIAVVPGKFSDDGRPLLAIFKRPIEA